MTGFDFCAWCGRLTTGLDSDGDPACKPGEGCLISSKPERNAKPYGQRGGRPVGSVNFGVIHVRGQGHTLKGWAKHFDVHQSSLVTRAKSHHRTIEAEIDDRLVHGNPPRNGGRKRAAGAVR